MTTDKNCLSYWFPRLESAGLPVPKTKIVRTEIRLVQLLDGELPEGWSGFLGSLLGAVAAIGLPCFLRTGMGSGKHNWKNCCCVTDAELLGQHVRNLIEWSECVDMFGLPYDVWAVREMLPVKPLAIAEAYGNFPMVKESRCFVGGGKVLCKHPYWPRGAVWEGFMRHGETNFKEDEIERVAKELQTFEPGEQRSINLLSSEVAKAFKDDGEWSVDLLQTDRGWYVTDMAEAGRSFHWEDCPRLKEQACH